jgi:hypothetical protein
MLLLISPSMPHTLRKANQAKKLRWCLEEARPVAELQFAMSLNENSKHAPPSL